MNYKKFRSAIIKLYQRWVEGAEECVEPLWWTVWAFVGITEPLQCRDADKSKEQIRIIQNCCSNLYNALDELLGQLPDAAVEGARSERHSLPHVPQQEVSLHLSVQSNIWPQKKCLPLGATNKSILPQDK